MKTDNYCGAKPTIYALGLTGYPLEHSFSPRMHNAALRALGLAGEYRLFPVDPDPAGGCGAAGLAVLLERLRRGELHGLNVTIPYKQAVIPLLDALSPAAQAAGAVNTILCREGKLVGENTDIPGFLIDLERFLPQTACPEKNGELSALVLGAGGSARAVAYALASTGWQVTVAARRFESAEALCEALRLHLPGDAHLQPVPLQAGSLWENDKPARLVVNATPVGMFPNPGASAWPEGAPFPAGAAVYDLVYNPSETALMKAARQAGLLVINGLGMLLEQAILAFELWTGYAAPREVMRQALHHQVELDMDKE